MREYVTFTRDQTMPCQHLDAIERQALDWLDKSKEQPGDRVLDVQFIHGLGLDDKYTTIDTSQLAEQVMHELLLMSTDVTVGEQVPSPPTRSQADMISPQIPHHPPPVTITLQQPETVTAR